MSKYTTTLGQLIDGGFNIGLQQYPIFDERHRGTLNQKIIDHYRFREIGSETPAMFKFLLNRTMNEVMPYYNQLYTIQDEVDGVGIFNNYDISELYEGSDNGKNQKNDTFSNTTINNGKSSTTTESTNSDTQNTKSQRNETPMGKLTDLYSEDYATETNQGTSINNGSVNGTAIGTDESTQDSSGTSEMTLIMDMAKNFTRTTKGKNSGLTYAELMNVAKDAILNVDMMVITELESCFMQVW